MRRVAHRLHHKLNGSTRRQTSHAQSAQVRIVESAYCRDRFLGHGVLRAGRRQAGGAQRGQPHSHHLALRHQVSDRTCQPGKGRQTRAQ